jgi:hypothetical protein
MLTTGDNRAPRSRGYVSVSKPSFGFFIAGSSIKVSGVRLRVSVALARAVPALLHCILSDRASPPPISNPPPPLPPRHHARLPLGASQALNGVYVRANPPRNTAARAGAPPLPIALYYSHEDAAGSGWSMVLVELPQGSQVRAGFFESGMRREKREPEPR